MGAIFKSHIMVQDTQLERLKRLSFKRLIKEIHQMDTFAKAQLAAKMDKEILYMYEYLEPYDAEGIPKDDKMLTEEFEHVMSKIKKYETMLYWLYEVDVMMGETELNRLIDKAEKMYEEDNEALVMKLKEDKDGTKHRVVMTVKEQLKGLYKEKEEEQPKTNDIMALAKSLTMKYNK